MPNRPATRNKNASKHPGLVDAKKKRKTKAEVAAERAAKAREDAENEAINTAKIKDVATVMKNVKKRQQEDEKTAMTPITARQDKPLTRQGAKLNVLIENSWDDAEMVRR